VGNESWYGGFFTKDADEPADWPELIVSIAGAPPQSGDADGDGVVNGGDYTLWADFYASGEAASVPEPGVLALLALPAALLVRRSRRRG